MNDLVESSALRRFYTFNTAVFLALLPLFLVCFSSPALAGDTKRFSLPTTPRIGKLLSSAESEVIVLPKPESSGSMALTTLGDALPTQDIKTLNSAGAVTGAVHVVSEIVSDSDSLYGVITRSSAGTFATILNQSEGEPFFYQVRPVGEITGGMQPHEIERLSVSELKSSMRCGLGDEVQLRSLGKSSLIREALTGQWREVEMLGVAPSEFIGGRSRENVAAQIANTTASANLFFEALELVIDLVGIQYFENSAGDPYAGAAAARSAAQILDVAESQWSGVSSPAHDVVVVFGRNSYSGVYGLAYTRSSCDAPSLSVVFATQGGVTIQEELTLAGTLAHELGHYVGMSHDSTKYPSLVGPGNKEGGSLMYPYLISSPGPFSQSSIDSYLAHSGIGESGGSCFANIAPPKTGTPDALTFLGGNSETVTLKEGALFQRVVSLADSPKGASYSLLEAADGMSFDAKSGLLTYVPSFSLADNRTPKRTVKAQILGEVAGKKAVKTLTFTVKNVNRAPVIRSKFPAGSIATHSGSRVSFRVRTVDLDKGDKAQVYLRSSLSALPGAPKSKVGKNFVDITWKIPSNVTGSYTLKFRALDQLRARTNASFTIVVAP